MQAPRQEQVANNCTAVCGKESISRDNVLLPEDASVTRLSTFESLEKVSSKETLDGAKISFSRKNQQFGEGTTACK